MIRTKNRRQEKSFDTVPLSVGDPTFWRLFYLASQGENLTFYAEKCSI